MPEPIQPGQPPAAPAGTPPAPQAPAAPAGTPPAEHPATVKAPWTGQDGVYKVGEAGKEVEWWNTIQEEPVRDLMKAKGYKNPDEVAMAYHNANKMINNAGDVVAIPKDAADEKGWNNIYTKLGRPDSPDKYEFTPHAELPSDPATVDFGKKMFYELGASPEKAAKLSEQWNNFVYEQGKAVAENERKTNENELLALTTKWGDNLDANKAAGQRVVQALGIPAELIAKIENNIGSAPIVELLAMIGSKSKEGTFVGGDNQGDPNNPDTMTAEQAAAKIAQLDQDPVFQKRYTTKGEAGHDEAVQLMVKLFAKAPKK